MENRIGSSWVSSLNFVSVGCQSGGAPKKFSFCRILPKVSPGSGGLGINQPDGAPGRSGARYQTVKLELALALWPLNWQLTVCVPVPLPVLVVVR